MWMTGCAPKCSTEHRHRLFIPGCEPFESTHREANPARPQNANQGNHWDQRQIRPADGNDQEEDETNECENDISTDEIYKTDSEEHY